MKIYGTSILYSLLLTNSFLVNIFCGPDSSDNDEYDFYADVYDNKYKYNVMEETDKLFESTFGSHSDKDFSADLMGKFEEMIETFENPSIEDDCTYKCMSGYKAVKRGGYVPVSNGCGSTLGFIKVKLSTTGYKGLEKCCDKHDICYGTCNKVRKECDEKFKNCMLHYCETDTHIKHEVKGRAPEICKYVAMTMHMGVESFGCDSFIDSQRKGCECEKQERSDL